MKFQTLIPRKRLAHRHRDTRSPQQEQREWLQVSHQMCGQTSDMHRTRVSVVARQPQTQGQRLARERVTLCRESSLASPDSKGTREQASERGFPSWNPLSSSFLSFREREAEAARSAGQRLSLFSPSIACGSRDVTCLSVATLALTMHPH